MINYNITCNIYLYIVILPSNKITNTIEKMINQETIKEITNIIQDNHSGFGWKNEERDQNIRIIIKDIFDRCESTNEVKEKKFEICELLTFIEQETNKY